MRAFLSTFFVMISISFGSLEEAFASSLDDSDFYLSSAETPESVSSKRENRDENDIYDSEEFSREKGTSKKRNLAQDDEYTSDDEKKNKTKKVKNNEKTSNSKKISKKNSKNNIVIAENYRQIDEKNLEIINNIVKLTKFFEKICATDLKSIIVDGKVREGLKKLENIEDYMISEVTNRQIDMIIYKTKNKKSYYCAHIQKNKINVSDEKNITVFKYNKNNKNVNLSINNKDVDNISKKSKKLKTHESEEKEIATEREMFLWKVENYFISKNNKKMEIRNFVKKFSDKTQQIRFRHFVKKLGKIDKRFELKSEGEKGKKQYLFLYFKSDYTDSTESESDEKIPNVMVEYIGEEEDETEEKTPSCSNSHNNIIIFNAPIKKNEINNNLSHNPLKLSHTQNQPNYNPMNHRPNFYNMQPHNNQNRYGQPVHNPMNHRPNFHNMQPSNNQNRYDQPLYNLWNQASPSNNRQFYNNQGVNTQNPFNLGFDYHNLNHINNNSYSFQNNTNREVSQKNIGDINLSLSPQKETSSIFNPSSSQASISLDSSNKEIIPVEKSDTPPPSSKDIMSVEENNSSQQSTLTWTDISQKKAQGWKLKDEKDRTGESLLKKYNEILEEIAPIISNNINANTEKDSPKLKKLEENLAKLEMRLPHHFDKIEKEKLKATFIDLVEEE